MGPAPDALQRHYGEKNDRSLLDLAAEPNSLTPEAQLALAQELQRRGLTAPEPVQSEAAAFYHPPQWVTVERFRDLSGAIVARGALEAAGVPCFLRDENTVRLDWQISNFIGGMRLQVPAQDHDAALTVLSQLMPDEARRTATALDSGERCPFCGSTDVHRTERGMSLRATVLWMFALSLPPGSHRWHCRGCDRNFPESDLDDAIEDS